MAEEKLLTVRETAHYLGVSEKAVIELSEQGVIPAYKVGGVYLRFRKDQLKSVKITPQVLSGLEQAGSGTGFQSGKRTFPERIADFIYYNDFYFLCLAVCLVLLYFVFKA
jgi:excisionase family DNA binding protein